MKAPIFLCILFVLLSSCDSQIPIDYVFINHSDSTLKVSYRRPGSSLQGGGDTSIYLQPDSSAVLYTKTIISNKVNNPEAGNDTIWSMGPTYVYRPDGWRIPQRYLPTARWGYTELSRYHGQLDFVFGNSDLH